MPKQLLIETMLVAPQVLVESSGKKLAPGVGMYQVIKESANGLLTIRLPVTTLDERNQNDRIYRTPIMELACRRAKPYLESRRATSTCNEHPEGPTVPPGEASHIVTKAWVEGKHLWNEWEILNTHNGRNLRALVEGKVAFGVSIRGLGSCDDHGNILEDYEYLGTDCVGNPSAKIYADEAQVVDPTAQKTESTSTPTRKSDTMDKKQYLQEQIVLLGSDKTIEERMKRAVKVEETLAGLSGREAAELYSQWDEAKNKHITEAAKASPVSEELAKKSEALTQALALLRRQGQALKTMRQESQKMEARLEAQKKKHLSEVAKLVGRQKFLTILVDECSSMAASALVGGRKKNKIIEGLKKKLQEAGKPAPAAGKTTTVESTTTTSSKPSKPVVESKPIAPTAVETKDTKEVRVLTEREKRMEKRYAAINAGETRIPGLI